MKTLYKPHVSSFLAAGIGIAAGFQFSDGQSHSSMRVLLRMSTGVIRAARCEYSMHNWAA